MSLTGLPATWKANDPISAARLNDLQRSMITNITVQQGTPLTMLRQGNNVVIGFRGQVVGSGLKVLFGKATAAVTSGNSVTLTPCKSISDGTATGAPNVTCNIVTPAGETGLDVDIAIDDILAYLPLTATTGILVNVKQGSAGSADLGDAPYQVKQMTTTTAAAWDLLRAGP